MKLTEAYVTHHRDVTSHVEVWIETASNRARSAAIFVTSHVEVWIETCINKI